MKLKPRVVVSSGVVVLQSKSLRKMVQQAFKQFAQWPLEDCVIKFYEKLSTVWRFDIERFPCALGVYVLVLLCYMLVNMNIHDKQCVSVISVSQNENENKSECFFLHHDCIGTRTKLIL